MSKQRKTQQKKWSKPTIKSITFQELSSLITVSACSAYASPCLRNMR